jgi:hypothetical protein
MMKSNEQSSNLTLVKAQGATIVPDSAIEEEKRPVVRGEE